MKQAWQHLHSDAKSLWRSLACGFVFGVALLLAGCNQPPEDTLKRCHQSARARGDGLNLTASDLGELVEECMSEKGYALKKDSDACHHDAASAFNKSCYYPNSWLGRLLNE